MNLGAPELFSASHRVDQFDSGEDVFDYWLRKQT